METLHRPLRTAPRERSGAALGDALARLEARWGSVAIRLGNGAAGTRLDPEAARPAGAVRGALALAPEPASAPVALPGEVVSTGFSELDELLGPGGLPRGATAVLQGDGSSGKTTLALRMLAEVQAQGGLAAWLDLGRTFDPLEAVTRGVELRWLVVLRPADPEEGLRLAGALLAGRAIDLLVVDLPPRLGARHEALLRHLAAHARRLTIRLVLLQPASLGGALQGALGEVAGVRLELARRDWIRLGRDVVGQRTAVVVAKNRFGPPGRQVELAIHYPAEGEQAADPVRLLDHGPPPRSLGPLTPPTLPSWTSQHASPPPRLAPSPPPPRGRPAAAAARAA
ncbi:MAG: hypothetical protein ACXWO7_03955, partial [Candidatus Limnocylindrales bacterium]